MIKCSKEIINKAVELNNSRKNYILMCSSGVDSIAGVHYLLSKVKQHEIPHYMVIHYNHKLRPQNDVMEKSFYDFMDSEFPAFIRSAIHRTQEDSEVTEAKLREARFNALMEYFHSNVIISFQHLNDCVESYLLNCIRGKEGFQPIPFWTEWKSHTNNVACHPFLFTKKQDFHDYCSQNHLWDYVVEDETNRVSKGSRRNMIRNEIIPILERDKVGLETIVSKKMKQRLMLDLLK